MTSTHPGCFPLASLLPHPGDMLSVDQKGGSKAVLGTQQRLQTKTQMPHLQGDWPRGQEARSGEHRRPGHVFLIPQHQALAL